MSVMLCLTGPHSLRLCSLTEAVIKESNCRELMISPWQSVNSINETVMHNSAAEMLNTQSDQMQHNSGVTTRGWQRPLRPSLGNNV